jgi:serine/threonine protein phosphatase PrpC
MAAARAAVEVLSGAVADSDRAPTGVTEGEVGSPSVDGAVVTEVLVEATRAAQRATLDTVEHANADDLNPPSTTFVAAVARRLEGAPASPDSTGAEIAVSVAWLGDSRAYWFDGDSARLLTEDHEIAGALTRWLGADAGVGEPDVVHHRFPALESSSNSMLMVCSDGLWRYFAPEVGEPAASLLDRLGGEGLAGVDLAEALVGFANGNGGHDNVTVGLWPAASPASAGPTPNEPDQGEEATP